MIDSVVCFGGVKGEGKGAGGLGIDSIHVCSYSTYSGQS